MIVTKTKGNRYCREPKQKQDKTKCTTSDRNPCVLGTSKNRKNKNKWPTKWASDKSLRALTALTKLGMFMKIINFCVFNKMVSERYCDSLQNEGSTTWNGEETVKLWVKNRSWTIPRNCHLALLIDLCTILCVNAYFFTTKEHLTKMYFCFLKFECY